jgi:hypothetical protein
MAEIEAATVELVKSSLLQPTSRELQVVESDLIQRRLAVRGALH